MNVGGKLFGVEKVKELLLSHNGDYLEFLDDLIDGVKSFNDSDSPRDDCTAIAIDFHRNPEGIPL